MGTNSAHSLTDTDTGTDTGTDISTDTEQPAMLLGGNTVLVRDMKGRINDLIVCRDESLGLAHNYRNQAAAAEKNAAATDMLINEYRALVGVYEAWGQQ